MGEWFTYIASIALAEKILGSRGASSRTTISILVVVRLVPNVLLSPIGGILADGRDRRHSMIFLDVIGALSPLLFFVAMHYESIGVIYLVTFLQQCISGLYEPCRSGKSPWFRLPQPVQLFMKL
jgi:dTMP kinase